MLLPRLVNLRRPESAVLEAEDIFSSSLGGVFFDDLQNQHGDDPENVILYQNSKFGQLELRVADVNGEEQRTKFAHYLWNAGVLVGELVGGRRTITEDDNDEEDEFGWRGDEWWVSKEEDKLWRVQGETVLELGAGVGLGGIVSVLAGAKEVAISDYPAPPLLENIKVNVAANVPAALRERLSVEGHKWGSTSTSFESTHSKHYTRIIAADCLWMPWEHEHLAQSMVHFLSEAPEARVLVIAGFHTGRAKIAPFFEEVVPEKGLEIEEIYEMNASGVRRPWAKERDGGKEDVGERKKWLVLARLKRASQSTVS